MTKLGQNFLIDEKPVERLVELANLRDCDEVLEAGSGNGILTHALAEAGVRVTSFEIDVKLASIAGYRLRRYPNAKVVNGDVLKADWPDFNKAVSSIPYSISRGFVKRLFAHEFELAVLLVQEEFAQKLASQPGDGNYRMVSALAQSTCKIEFFDIVKPESFRPQPRVKSRIITLRQEMPASQEYIDFLIRVFNHKNKLLGGLFETEIAFSRQRARNLPPKKLLHAFSALREDGSSGP